jgi:integrase
VVNVRLKGVHSVRAKLASGKVAVYHYAWKGGPRLTGAPGSPEFVASFTKAHESRKAVTWPVFRRLIVAFKSSPEFTGKGAHTLRSYRRYLDLIDNEFGDMPIAALDDMKVRKHFMEWRDGMAATPRTADYAVSTLKRLLAWSVDRGEIEHNRADKIGRLHSADKSENIWTADDFAAFRLHASKELQWAVDLASCTGLRQGDLISLAWSNYDGQSFMVRTSKRGKVAIIPATGECRALMKRIAKRQAVVLTTERGKRPWTADGLRASFNAACKRAKVTRTFHDLRRTAATRLVSSGVPSGQVAMAMGWSEDAVEALKRKYVSRSAVVQSMLANMGEDA